MSMTSAPALAGEACGAQRRGVAGEDLQAGAIGDTPHPGRAITAGGDSLACVG